MYNKYKQILNERYLGCSKWTRQNFMTLARQLPPPDELTREFILEFLESKENPWTRWAYYKTLRVILPYLNKSELLEGITIRQPKTTLKRSHLLTQADIHAILRVCTTLRDRAIVELLIESGCRIRELLNLNIEDIKHNDRMVLVTFNGKTGPREIPLLKDNLPSFLFYVATHPSGKGKVFIRLRKRTEPVGYRGVIARMNAIYKLAGIPKPKKPFHVFRHTKATHLVELGVPEAIIRRFMGWTPGSNMIEIYVHLTGKSVRDYFARLYGIDPEPVEPLYPEEEKQRLKEILG